MENTTMTMNAVACVLSVRPRPVGQLLMTDAHAQGQGTTVSTVAPRGLRAVAAAAIQGHTPVAVLTFDPDYKPTDVARSRLGRPPV
jgi:hypothetical protein